MEAIQQKIQLSQQLEQWQVRVWGVRAVCGGCESGVRAVCGGCEGGLCAVCGCGVGG